MKHPSSAALRASRRAFLRRGAAALAGISLMPLAGCEFNSVTPRRSGSEVPFLTPVGPSMAEGGFFVQNGGQAGIIGWSMPDLGGDDWSLAIDGLVAAPQTLTLEDLRSEEPVTVLKTLRCIVDSNEYPGLIGTALWRGVSLLRLLERAGLDTDRTRRLRLHGADGFTNNIPLDLVTRPLGGGGFEPLLVTHMNGQPLPRAHGYPARLLLFDQYGYKNVKWLTRIEATDDDAAFGTYQQVLGYTDDGTIRVSSKATNPVSNETLPAGTTLVQGFALSGASPVRRVEIAVDEGPFEEARLTPVDELIAEDAAILEAAQFDAAGRSGYPFAGVWTKWTFRWDATPGLHELQVRATDGAGNQQQPTDTDPLDGFAPIVRIPVRVLAQD